MKDKEQQKWIVPETFKDDWFKYKGAYRIAEEVASKKKTKTLAVWYAGEGERYRDSFWQGIREYYKKQGTTLPERLRIRTDLEIDWYIVDITAEEK